MTFGLINDINVLKKVLHCNPAGFSAVLEMPFFVFRVSVISGYVYL